MKFTQNARNSTEKCLNAVNNSRAGEMTGEGWRSTQTWLMNLATISIQFFTLFSNHALTNHLKIMTFQVVVIIANSFNDVPTIYDFIGLVYNTFKRMANVLKTLF